MSYVISVIYPLWDALIISSLSKTEGNFSQYIVYFKNIEYLWFKHISGFELNISFRTDK